MLTGSCNSQYPTVMSDLVPRQKVTSALGLIRLLQGIGALLGPFMGGRCHLTGIFYDLMCFFSLSLSHLDLNVLISQISDTQFTDSGADPRWRGWGGGGGGGLELSEIPPPPFGRSPNSIKRGKTSRACTRMYSNLVVNSFMLQCVRLLNTSKQFRLIHCKRVDCCLIVHQSSGKYCA